MKIRMRQGCYYPNNFLKAKQKCLEKAVMILETIDPPAEGPYAAKLYSSRDAGLGKVFAQWFCLVWQSLPKGKIAFLMLSCS